MAHDFRNKTFQKVLRGYAPEEVDDYIAYLNEEYRNLERRTADSERKLALALKKLEESAKSGGSDTSVGPAAREAASKLMREAETKRSEMLAMAEQQANEAAERIVREAETQAEAVVAEAVGQAEAILADAQTRAETVLADAQAQADAHRNDVKTIYAAARGMYDEIGAFREKLFGLYNEHLDAIEDITDSAAQFIEGIDGQYSGNADGEEVTEDAEEILPAETDEPAESGDIPDAEPAEEPDLTEELPMEQDEFFREFLEEEAEPTVEEEPAGESEPEPEEPAEEEEEPELGDEVASNLAFMDRLFAAVKQADAEQEDLYIDLPDDFEEEPVEEEGEFYEEELPSIMIDWKNRSAAQIEETPDESTDFRPAEGFEDFFEDDYAEDYPEEEYGDETVEENYDDYVPADDADVPTEEPSADDADEPDEDEEEDEGLRAMDTLFRENKSQRDMSLTEEFNIIFDDSKSHANVKEIRRQPTVSPEAPKNPKKHKNF